ncbi:RNA methyltransferase [Mucilaginibacter robiniae]|uniref:RNA methyltransferase n=1 Tax=Mucilaginibacter robiniae TaxID=2728022 RepID=A0A7L5DTR6_9SPHI|nr:RNA methyltransferase [Mucilaginibacter robiniae]QJD94442.1 RNA methyltransferase [Mucilaginibacter robiniae]
MLSKSQISLIKSLQHKKFRREHQLFVVEGYKSVAEFITSPYSIQTLFYTPAIAAKLPKIPKKLNFQEITVAELEKITGLTTPQDALALVQVPDYTPVVLENIKQKFTLVLDGIQDPGNLGTIIRTADWFGIENIICSTDTVDAYNPKVVQATMGSLARVKVHYTTLTDLLTTLPLPIYGALLNGKNIYTTNFGEEGLIVMGNEGNGLRPDIEQLISEAITIPRVGNAESLNVGIATALFCSELNRKRYK